MIKRIILVILLVIWMVSVFMFSAQQGDNSGAISGNTIRAILNLIPSVRQMEPAEREGIVAAIEPYARKLAHFTIYMIGGIILYLNANQYALSEDKKFLLATIMGSLYSITDEVHQMFVPRTKSESLAM